MELRKFWTLTALFLAVTLVHAGCASKSSSSMSDAPAASEDTSSTDDLYSDYDDSFYNEPTEDTTVTPTTSATDLQKVYFAFDQSNLNDSARSTLQTNFDVLNGSSDSKVVIEGHCDERGTDEYNLALGERRAQAIKDYLVSLGISSTRLSTISYGEEQPAVQGGGESSWSQNRRGEFRLTD